MSSQKIRILIADDHSLVRKSIRVLLESQKDMEVVATAVNGQEAVQLAQDHAPDIIVMDINMPQMDGIHATERIRALNLPSRVILFSMNVSAVLIQQAIKKGVSGYVMKQDAVKELPKAIRTVQQSLRYFSPSIPTNYFPSG